MLSLHVHAQSQVFVRNDYENEHAQCEVCTLKVMVQLLVRIVSMCAGGGGAHDPLQAAARRASTRRCDTPGG